MRMNTPKLLQRNLLTIIVLFGLVVIVTTLFSSLSLRTNLTNEFVNRGTDIADSLATTSTELLLNRDASTIQSRIDSFLDPETGVAYIFVVNDENEFISHTFVPEVPQELQDIVADDANNLPIQDLEITDKGRFINISAPVLSGTAGNIHVGMDVGIISERIQSAIFNQILLVTLIFIVGVFIAYLQTIRISRPLLQLTEYVQSFTSSQASPDEFAEKEAEIQVVSQRNDEIGQLAQNFQQMVTEVRSYEEGLENRVAARTQDLNLASEIGRQVAQAHDVDEVLVAATTLMKDQFDLYQVQIYLSDQERKNLILRASDGHAGSQLLDAGHTLPIDENSLNGSAAFSKDVVIVADTQESESFRPNPLLPDTRSETAVPLLVGDNVVGVLDLQSNEPHAFTEESLPAFITLAGQLAIAIENSNLFAEAARQAERLSTLNEMSAAVATATDINEIYKVTGQYTQQIVGGMRASLGILAPDGQTFEVLGLSGEKGAIPMNTHLPVSKTAVGLCIRESRLIINADGEPEKYADAKQLVAQGLVSVMNAPIVVRSKTIGAINIASNQANAFGTQEGTLMQQIASLLSGALENLQLLTQTENALSETSRQAERLSSLNEMSTAITIAADINEVYKVAGSFTQKIVGGQRASLGMLDPDGQTFEVLGLSGEKGAIPMNTHLPVSKTAVGLCIQEGRLIIDADGQPEKYVDAQKLVEQGLLSTISAPLIVSDKVIGSLNVGSNQIKAFGTPERSLMQQIASLLSGAIENRQLLTQTQEALASVKTNESLMRTIIDSTPDWIFITDTNHRYQMVNKAYADSMNLAPKDFIGKTALEMGIPEDIVKGNPEKGVVGFWPLDDEVMASGEIHIIDEEPAVVDGEPRVLTTTRVPLKDSAGNANRLVGYIHDITDIKEAEATMAKQAADLQTVTSLSTIVSTMLDTNQLLHEIVNRTKESFNLYHTHIYLLDETDNTLNLVAGAGEIGAEMVASGHLIPFDHENSLVAKTARTRQGVIVNDVAADPTFLPNELLPNTQSEMAVPIMVGNNILGVMDVQSDKLNYFTETDINIQTALAAQIAVALQNASIFEQVDRQASVIRSTPNIIATATLDGTLNFMNESGLRKLEYELDEVIGQSATMFYPTEESLERQMKGREELMKHGMFLGENLIKTKSGKIFPVEQLVSLIRDKQGQPQLMAVNMTDISERKKAEEKQQALNTELAEQLERVNALQRAMTRDGWQAFMTTTAAERAIQGFEFNQGGIKPLTTEALTASKNGKGNKAAKQTDSEIFSPVTIQGTAIGKIGVRNPSGDPLTDEQRNLLASLTGQVAEALDRARLFEETELGRQEIEAQAAELTTVNEISDLASTQLNLNDLVTAVGNRLEETFNAQSVYISLYNAKQETFSFPYFHNKNDGHMEIPSRSLHEGGGFTAQIIKTRKPILHNHIEDEGHIEAIIQRGGNIVGDGRTTDSYLGVPMIIGDTIVGVIAVSSYRENHIYDESDQQLLSTLASTIGVAIQNSRQFEETQRRANREALVNEISQKIQSAATVESAMQTAVAELGKALNLKQAIVKLNKPGENKTE